MDYILAGLVAGAVIAIAGFALFEFGAGAEQDAGLDGAYAARQRRGLGLMAAAVAIWLLTALLMATGAGSGAGLLIIALGTAVALVIAVVASRAQLPALALPLHRSNQDAPVSLEAALQQWPSRIDPAAGETSDSEQELPPWLPDPDAEVAVETNLDEAGVPAEAESVAGAMEPAAVLPGDTAVKAGQDEAAPSETASKEDSATVSPDQAPEHVDEAAIEPAQAAEHTEPEQEPAAIFASPLLADLDQEARGNFSSPLLRDLDPEPEAPAEHESTRARISRLLKTTD